MSEISKSKWVRTQIMIDPTIDYTKLMDIWSKTDEEERSAKPTQQDLYTGRREICKRWFIEKITDLPRKKDGSANHSQMLKRLMSNTPSLTNGKVIEIFASDGITVNRNLYYSLLYSSRKSSEKMSEKMMGESTEPTGPRARFVDPKRPEKRPRKKKVVQESAPKIDACSAEHMERQIEKLLQEASDLHMDQLLLKDLLQARRRASAMALGY